MNFYFASMHIGDQSGITHYLSAAARDSAARREIDNFLRAVSSYPESFARNPELSFEQHLSGIQSSNPAVDRSDARFRQ